MKKGFSIPKDAGCLPDGERAYDNSSRAEQKRPHQWCLDGAEAELFPSKRQAVDVANSSSYSGISSSNVSSWGNVSSFNSAPSQFAEQLLGSEAVRAINFDERNVPSVSVGSMNLGRKAIDDPYMNNSSFGLSMSHTLDDPRSGDLGGIRKNKVSQVRDPGNGLSMPLEPSRTRGDCMPAVHGYGKVDDVAVSMGLPFSRADDVVLSVGDSFISMAQPFNKEHDNSFAMEHRYKGGIPDSFSRGENVTPIGGSFSKGEENIISTGPAYTKSDANTIPVTTGCKKWESNTTSVSDLNTTEDGEALSFNKGESIISFTNFNYGDDGIASGRLVCNYESLMDQPSVQSSETLNQKDMVVSGPSAPVSNAHPVGSGGESTSRKKEEQKLSRRSTGNNFPSNVRSLLATGVLDGVPVKYSAWSREQKELRGVIKGSGYQCGCESCNFTKVVNAYEFERHAGCKTKHPNNHIHFENGKTIYSIVQELRTTPQNMLFDVIQTITGSPINQKSFRIWKESFLAATRELQRIYGKDEGKLTS